MRNLDEDSYLLALWVQANAHKPELVAKGLKLELRQARKESENDSTG